MFCPKCKRKYGKEITFCTDCKMDLVAQSSPDSDIEMINPIEIKFVANPTEAELIMNLLRENGIQCFSKCRETGGYMNIYMGYSVYGEDIYVDKADCEKALEMLCFFAAEPEPAEEEDSKPENGDASRGTHSTALKITFIVAASVIILSLLLPVVIYAVSNS